MSEEKAAADTPEAAETEVKDPAESIYPEGEESKDEEQSTEEDGEKSEEEKPEGEEEAGEEEAEDEASETDEEKSEDEKSAKVPEKYDFETDDDSPLSDAALDKIAQYAKEQGLSQEAAQKLVDIQEDNMKQLKEAQVEELKTAAEGWKSAAEADKEIGGDEFGKNCELAKRVVDRFGTEDFKQTLNETGLGNHPELLRFVSRIGREVSEDTLVLPGSQNTKAERTYEDLFYGEGAQ